jgi:uncharacterized membrane protein
MTTPSWSLSLIYWLHMLATVIWIGGLAAVGLLVIPAARRTLDDGAYSGFLLALQKRLDPLAWLSLAVLTVTGLFQMSASPSYQGFLKFDNRWAIAILIKHLLFLVMIVVSAYITWGVLPGMRRAAILRSQGHPAGQSIKIEREEVRLQRLNLILGVLILALTAIARTS